MTLGLRVLGWRGALVLGVWGLGFCCLGFSVWGLCPQPYKPWGSALRVAGVEEPGLKCKRLSLRVQVPDN